MQSIEDEARRLIGVYVDHLEDAEYVRAIFGLVDVPSISGLILGMLRSGEREASVNAMLFICDVVNYGMLPEFGEHLPESGIYPMLGKLVYAPDSNVRHNAVHTIGKIGPSENAHYLADAFPTYLERYPIELADLLFELIWLSSEARQRELESLDTMASSSLWLVRWATLEAADHYDHPQLWDVPSEEQSERIAQFERLYEGLAADEGELIRAEAIHALARLRHRRDSSPLAREEGRARKETVKQLQPTLPHAVFKIGVSNYLHAIGRADYDIPLLDALARYRAGLPIRRPFDWVAYACAFETWRAQDAARSSSRAE